MSVAQEGKKLMIYKAPEPSAYAAAAYGMTPASMVAFRLRRWISSATRGVRLATPTTAQSSLKACETSTYAVQNVHMRGLDTAHIPHIRPAQPNVRLMP